MEHIPAKRLLIRSKDTGWFGTDYTMNLYRGCCHGCIYCDSRSDCYRIEHFDQVRAKENALPLLRDELHRKIRPGIVGLGSMSDPYNPFEAELQLTRHALELLDAYQFGAAIATKSDLIARDIDVLSAMRERVPVLCKITVTTTDETLAAQLEPHAPSPVRRLEAVQKLASAGIFTGILLMPVLPYLEDSVENVLSVVEVAAQAGARFVYPACGRGSANISSNVWRNSPRTCRGGICGATGTGTSAPAPMRKPCGRSSPAAAGSWACCIRCSTSPPPISGATGSGS